MENSEGYCKNCGEEVSHSYCGNCGQRAVVGRVTFRETFTDLANGLFSLDAPIVKTLKGLFSNPGRLFRNYLDGQRKAYYKPVAFFILASFVYLLIRSFIGFDPFNDTSVAVEENSVNPILTEARNFMLLHIDKFLFFFVITLAIWMKLFFYRHYRLAEFFAISFYLIGVYTIIVTLNMFYIQYLGDEQFLGMTAMWIYFVIAMISFFQTHKIWVGIKSFFIYLLAVVSYIFLAFSLSYLIVSLR